MRINNAVFLKSAADSDGFITSDKPMIAVAGKSNVGKSSLINMLAGQNKLARTSDAPGRTRLVNYFDFGEFVLADLPGYGYAEVAKAEKRRWAALMSDFFACGGIAHALSLVDVRHAPTADDKDMIQMLYAMALPFTIIATKCDKLGKSKVKPRISELAAELAVAPANIVATSAVDKRGREEMLALIERVIAREKGDSPL